MWRILWVLFLIGCGSAPVEEVRVQIPTSALPTPRLAASLRGTPTPEPQPTLVTLASRDSADPLMQYRIWMEEAHNIYPYTESIDQMWQVMLCESSGDPTHAGPYYGLFQYLPSTWEGDWNPYREAPINDPKAQIFATAKAWHEGNQSWWGCYGR